MQKYEFLKSKLGRRFSGLAGVIALLALLLTMPTAALAQSATTTYKVTMKEGTVDADKWKAKAGTGEAKALPLEGVAPGAEVTLQYEGRKRVMSVRATKKAAPEPIDLSTLTGDYTAQDGEMLTGTLNKNVKISIAEKATVTLKDAKINADGEWTDGFYAGLNCVGDATIMLVGENSVKGFYEYYPGIYVPENKTLTIQGDGSLDAQSNGFGAGIGGGYIIACGNITIEGGIITATGGINAAGIGGGFRGSCGDILIKGGTVEAEGGKYAAGIGGGLDATCGDITITSGVTKVTATKGTNALYSIGKGEGSKAKCGTVTVGCTLGTDGKPEAGSGKVYNDGISQGKYIYPEKLLPLTMEALTNGTIKVVVDENISYNKVKTEGMQYAVNDGEKEDIYTTTKIDVEKGYRVTFYGNGTKTDCYWGTEISGGDAEVMVYGNIMSLVDEGGFATANALSQGYAFYALFEENTTLKDASGLLLPATELAKDCYNSMFWGCSAMTTGPAELPATTLAEGCYIAMFSGCTALTAGPAELPATTLAENCYYSMFYGCSALTAAPKLPASRLANLCYNNMFRGCSKLTAAPTLPATTLVYMCYDKMFKDCKNLASVTCLATSGFDAENCLYDWLDGAGSGVTGTKTLYVAPGMTGASWNKGNFTVTAIGQ